MVRSKLEIMIGLGVMINSLGGNEETVNAVKSAINKVIESVSLTDNKLVLSFKDGTGIYLFDDGQSCCESRYMVTDDDLNEYSGATVMDFELKKVDDIEHEYDVHEVQFIEVKTDKGVITVSNHNKHNGYYGGFWIVARPI